MRKHLKIVLHLCYTHRFDISCFKGVWCIQNLYFFFSHLSYYYNRLIVHYTDTDTSRKQSKDLYEFSHLNILLQFSTKCIYFTCHYIVPQSYSACAIINFPYFPMNSCARWNTRPHIHLKFCVQIMLGSRKVQINIPQLQ